MGSTEAIIAGAGSLNSFHGEYEIAWPADFYCTYPMRQGAASQTDRDLPELREFKSGHCKPQHESIDRVKRWGVALT